MRPRDEGMKFTGEAELGASREWVDAGVRLPSVAQVEAAKQAIAGVEPPFRDARHVFARETLIIAREFPKTFSDRGAGLRIGELFIAAVPGEPFVELGLEIRASLKGRAVFPMGFQTGTLAMCPRCARTKKAAMRHGSPSRVFWTKKRRRSSWKR
jgi:hypothetical protein